MRHHKVDPLDYDKHCDASLPLETVLKVDSELQHLLASIDREKCHVWALTNAYVFVSRLPLCDGAAGLLPLSPSPRLT